MRLTIFEETHPHSSWKSISYIEVKYPKIVALERLKVERINGVGQIPHPLDNLPTSDKPKKK